MESLYGGKSHRRVTVRDIAAAKGVEKWPMLTAYEELTAGIFDSVGIPVLLVGDSAASNFLGYENTIPVTVDELIPLARAVVRGTKRAMVIADLPFGSYEGSAAQALATATRFMKEAGVQGVKLEGGTRVVEQVKTLVSAGIPVMGHLGLTPQSMHALGGYRVQGRGELHVLQRDAVAPAHLVRSPGDVGVHLRRAGPGVEIDLLSRSLGDNRTPVAGARAGTHGKRQRQGKNISACRMQDHAIPFVGRTLGTQPAISRSS